MADLSRFKSGSISKTVKFNGVDTQIQKLTVSQVMTIQETVKEVGETDDSMKILFAVIRLGANDFKDASDDDLKDFPLEELSRLSDDIMKHSGLGKNLKA